MPTKTQAVIFTAYILSTIKIVIGLVHAANYLITGHAHSIMSSSEPMAFETSVNFVVGGLVILMVLWLHRHLPCSSTESDNLRIVNDRLAEGVLEDSAAQARERIAVAASAAERLLANEAESAVLLIRAVTQSSSISIHSATANALSSIQYASESAQQSVKSKVPIQVHVEG